jgi:acylpyruvate hydrolase
MRLFHVRRDDGPALLASDRERTVDVALALGDQSAGVLSGLIALGPDALDRLRAALAGDGESATGHEPPAPLLDRPGRVFCVGRNYVAHRDEFDREATPWPEIFLRLPSTVTGAEIVAPSVSEKVDFEGEVALVIGRGGRHIAAADAPGHILGFTAANDATARDWQHRGQQWTAGKNFDATCPIGPALVTADALPWDDLGLETRVNGETLQSSRTSLLIFDIPSQIEFISSWTALVPGDVILTGTPGGVGAARTPPLFLAPGDDVEVEVEGVGTLRSRVVADEAASATTRWHDVANDGQRYSAR